MKFTLYDNEIEIVEIKDRSLFLRNLTQGTKTFRIEVVTGTINYSLNEETDEEIIEICRGYLKADWDSHLRALHQLNQKPI